MISRKDKITCTVIFVLSCKLVLRGKKVILHFQRILKRFFHENVMNELPVYLCYVSVLNHYVCDLTSWEYQWMHTCLLH